MSALFWRFAALRCLSASTSSKFSSVPGWSDSSSSSLLSVSSLTTTVSRRVFRERVDEGPTSSDFRFFAEREVSLFLVVVVPAVNPAVDPASCSASETGCCSERTAASTECCSKRTLLGFLGLLDFLDRILGASSSLAVGASSSTGSASSFEASKGYPSAKVISASLVGVSSGSTGSATCCFLDFEEVDFLILFWAIFFFRLRSFILRLDHQMWE